jgi:ABC-type lipoprotein release transport system permease subunit
MNRSAGLVLRLAHRNLRRRPRQAVLLLVTLTIATFTLGTAMALQGIGDGPWNRVFRATNGPHVTFIAFQTPDQPEDAARLADLRRRVVEMAASPGVVAVGGPWTHLFGSLQVPRGTEDITAEVRDLEPSAVDQPVVTDGHWLSLGGGVVLEHGLAETLGLAAGDTVTINGRPFPIAGVGLSVSAGPFPLTRPAQLWVDPGTAAAMRAQGMVEEGFALGLRLDDPARAPAFVAAHEDLGEFDLGSSVHPELEAWNDSEGSQSDVDTLAAVLYVGGTLLALLAVATAAVIVADRMAAQTRQIGTLKAVGVTPRQVVLVVLTEHLAVAAVATALGLFLGRLVAPRLAASSATLLGDPEVRPVTARQVAIVAGVAAVTVVLGTVRPARRSIRHSTLRALATEARPPRRPGALARLVAEAGVPLPGVLGLRSAWRRPTRLLTNAVGLTLGVAVVVVALGLRASLRLIDELPVEPGSAAVANPTEALYDQVRTVVIATAALLLVLACVNAFVVATFAARDSARNHAVLRAVGATPRQTTVALIVSQLGASAVAVVVGIPLGLGLWRFMDGGDLPPVPVPAGSLVLLAVVVPIGFAALVALPARRLAQRAIAPALAPE